MLKYHCANLHIAFIIVLTLAFAELTQCLAPSWHWQPS